MGCFDEFSFVNGAPKCAAGHDVPEVQTKDLDEGMRHYIVSDGEVFVADARQAAVSIEKSGPDMLYRVTRQLLTRVAVPEGTLVVYSACDRCDPVYTDGQQTWGDQVTATSPWCEWEMAINAEGLVAGFTPIRNETREELKHRLSTGRGTVLPDDDRIVQRALKNRRR